MNGFSWSDYAAVSVEHDACGVRSPLFRSLGEAADWADGHVCPEDMKGVTDG